MTEPFVVYNINPAFDRHPDEARLVGRILASFGEIEFSVCRNAGNATNMGEQIRKAFYRLRMTSGRFAMANALAKPIFVSAGLSEEYSETGAMVERCLQIRNQYAHCNWADHAPAPESGLFFADLQKAAESDDAIFESLVYRHVDVTLLDAQVRHFQLTMDWLTYLDIKLAVQMGKLSIPALPKPPKSDAPPLYNPPEIHVPPFLSVDHQALHLARARGPKGGPPTPTAAQQALDKARAEKRSKRQADRDRMIQKRSENERRE
jgi:hypothetical protein